MAILILPVCFVAILLNLALVTRTLLGKRELITGSALVFCFLTVAFTELLSQFKVLNFSGILICWGFTALAGLVNAFFNRAKLRTWFVQLKVSEAVKGASLSVKLMAAALFALIIILLVQGIVYPPNNWDSMTYHLARITSWISHNSVDIFPTHITRQLYQPPFAEYVLMHVNMLNKGDYFANSVQLGFLCFTLMAISMLVQRLGFSQRMQWASALLCLIIPEVLLQATSTQNDIVAGFFIISTVYFAWRAIDKPNGLYFLFLALAAGLAILTKGTAYIFLAPVAVVAVIIMIVNIFKKRLYSYIFNGVISLLIILVLNAGFWLRNFSYSGNFLGVDKQESSVYANEGMSPGLLLSNIIKNCGLHSGIKGSKLPAQITDTLIHKLHHIIGVDVNNKAVNYRGMKFTTQTFTTHEDSAPNLLHFLFIAVALAIIAIRVVQRKCSPAAIILAVILSLQFILFCGYLKWQPWHSRLHVPMFMLAVPLLCYAAGVSVLFKKVMKLMLPVMLLYGVLVIVNNNLRPLKYSYLRQDRYQKYFMAKPDAYPEYLSVKKQIEQYRYKNIGLLIGEDDWQYPLFVNCYSQTLNPVHIKVTNYTHKAGKPVKIDCIVTTRTNALKITYKGKDFYNQNPQNKIIRIYK